MSIKAVLFDFDGTLADTLPLSFNAFKSVFKQYDNREVTNEELVAMFGPTEEGIIDANFANKPSVQDAIQDYYSYYEQKHHNECQCEEEIIHILHFLKENGVKIGVVTGKSRRSFDISTTALQLDSYFDVSITGDDVVQPKPHPEGIHKALHTLGIDPENAIFIGDSNADILAGKAAGLRTYAVQWLSTCQSLTYDLEPDGLFTNVAHFRELLEKEVVIHGPKWLEWAKQIQAIAQTGLTYTQNEYDIERYEALRDLSVDILANYTFTDKEKIALTFASDLGYATPKVDIRGVVFRDNKILLIREKIDGAWALPGGWADIGFSPSEIAVKEVKEESGFDVVPVRLLAVMDKKFHNHPPEPYHVYKLFIRCEIVGGAAAAGLETSAVEFFDADHLPELSLERNTAKQIRTMFEFLEHPDKPVILD